jgi:exonuclease SbcD
MDNFPKTLITADWHLNQKGREADFLEAIDQIVWHAQLYPPDLILHGGDWFASNRPGNEWRREGAKRAKLLAEIAPVVTVPGNHDITAEASAIGDWRPLAPHNLIICPQPQAVRLPFATVVAIPWLTTRYLAEFGKSKVQETQELLRAIENLVEFISLNIPDDLPRILLTHASCLGGDMGNHRPSVLGRDPVWRLDTFESFDLTVLGHFHKAQVVQKNPLVVYPGSPERVTFGERDEAKGFYTYDGGKLEFHELDTRPMVQIEGTPGEILNQLPGVPDEAMLKIKVHLGIDDPRFRVAGSRWHSLKIEEIRPRQERESRLNVLEGLGPIGALKFFFESRGHDEEKVEMFMGRVEQMMEEVEA